MMTQASIGPISSAPQGTSQAFADTVRQHGTPQHWQLHCGLSWISERFERGALKAEGTDIEDVQTPLATLLTLPGKTERAAIGSAALVLLKKYGPQLSSSDYAAIYMQLSEGAQ
ncbi:MAG: hypothetical protein ACYCUI_07070 [Vulcanimicrobiaceae bacterium]